MHFIIERLAGVLAPVLTILLFIGSAYADDGKDAIKEKAAVVNGSIITLQEFEAEVDRARKSSLKRGQKINDSKLENMRKYVLESFINRELLYHESQQRGISIKDDEVSKQLDTFKKRFPGTAEYEKAITRMKLTESEIAFQIKRNLAIRKLINSQIADNIGISEKAAKDYYDANPEAFKRPEQLKASHILIKVDPKADEKEKANARKKIEDIQDKLKKGEDFAELAKIHSQGPSGPKGGDLGYFTRGRMVKPFEEAANALAPGEVSDRVETRFGYHLIKVFDKKPAGTIPYKEATPKIIQFLKQKKIEQEMAGYIDKLKESAEIERFILTDKKKG